MLAVLVLFAVVLSVAPVLHQRLHANTAAGDFCLICSLAKGQVSASELIPVLAIFVSVLLFCLPRFSSEAICASDVRLAPSRAPPSAFSSNTVVG